jgi:hypothetical protein
VDGGGVDECSKATSSRSVPWREHLGAIRHPRLHLRMGARWRAGEIRAMPAMCFSISEVIRLAAVGRWGRFAAHCRAYAAMCRFSFLPVDAASAPA